MATQEQTQEDIIALQEKAFQKNELHKQKMRTYQFKKYHDNKALAREISLKKYYKKQGLICADDKHRYGGSVHLVAKSKKTLNFFKSKDEAMLKTFLKDYLATFDVI